MSIIVFLFRQGYSTKKTFGGRLFQKQDKEGGLFIAEFYFFRLRVIPETTKKGSGGGRSGRAIPERKKERKKWGGILGDFLYYVYLC